MKVAPEPTDTNMSGAVVMPVDSRTDGVVTTYTTNPTQKYTEQKNIVTAPAGTGGAATIAEEKKSYCRQTYVLTKKNLLVQLRNKTATAAQLGVGVLFIVLLLVMDIAVKENNKNNDWYVETRDPIVQTAFDFTQCTPTPGEKCYSLFLYGNSETEIVLTNKITTLLKLPGRDVEYGWNFVNQTSFPSIKEYLFDNLNVSRIGLEFAWPPNSQQAAWQHGEDSSVLPTSYILHYNGTQNCGDLGIFNCEKINKQLLVPLMTAVDSIILRQYATNYPDSKDTARITASFKDFPHPAFSFSLDVVERFGSTFFFMAVSFNFIVQLRNLVSEKMFKLRDSMKIIGMLDSAYWSSWLISSLFTNTLSTCLLIAMGSAAQFPFFLKNDFLAYFIHFWLTMFAFTCSAFFVSSLVHNEQTAINIGLGFFILFFLAGGFAAAIVFGSVLTNEYQYDWLRVLFMALPGCAAPFGFLQGFGQLVTSSSSLGATGFRMAELSNNIIPPKLMENGTIEEPFWSLQTTWLWMLANSSYCLLFAAYFDNALPNSYGRSEGWCFCLRRKFWCGSEQLDGRTEGAVTTREDRSGLTQHLDDDMAMMVQDEAKRMIEQKWEATEAPAVQVLGMEIFFNAGKVKAVQGITYGIEKDELFVLLGHNGAGKSTTINALVGNIRATGGDARVFGYSCDNQMRTIHKMMGICPQHDILWDQLTGREHLELFAALRGMPKDQIQKEVDRRIIDVNLMQSQHVTSGAYSGGMKRRLSIAIALLGDPKIVYLDEPTTGMDPVTRRDVWDMIIRAKKGRVIVLTTHSMEEADVLGDRVAIMSHGKIQALGTALGLKKEYGGGYKMNVIVQDEKYIKAVQEFMLNGLKGSELVGHVDMALFFKVPDTDDATLVHFFESVESRRQELGISDFSVGLTTLEEVFLELSKRDNTTNSHNADVQNSKPKKRRAGEDDDNVMDTEKKNVAALTSTLEGKQFKPTGWNYLTALTIKTIQFQKTRWLQCCCIMIMPVFLMVILLLLNLLFTGIKITSVCGPGITEENCAKDGYNLTCVQNILERSFASEPPSLRWGEVQRRGTAGPPINRNCGGDRPAGYKRNRVCYYGLEKPTFDAIPFTSPTDSTGLGSIGHTRDAAIVDWYDGFRYTMSSSTCAAVFDDQFDYDIVCADDKSPDCRAKVNKLTLTKSWRAQNPADGSTPRSGAGSSGLESFLATCLPGNETDSSSTSRRRQRRLAEYEPSDDEIAAYDDLVSNKTVCEGKWLLDVSARLKDAPNIPSSVTSTKTGVLGNFTTAFVSDEGYSTIQTAVLNNGWEYLTLNGKKDQHCRIDHTVVPAAFLQAGYGNLSDICNSTIAVKDGKGVTRTMEYIHNASNCGECFGGALSNMATLLYMADGFETNMASLWFVLPTGLKMGLSPSSLSYFAVNIFNQNTFKKWSTSLCLLQKINQLYLEGNITTGTMTIPNPNPGGPPFMVPTPTVAVPKSMVFGEGIKLWDKFWPGFYAGMMLGFDSTSINNGISAWKTFCDLDQDMDAVRGVSFQKYDTSTNMQTFMFDDWGGQNVETQYMKEAAPRNLVGYKHHYYNTQTMAFDFVKFNTNEGIFDYVAYFNNSATKDEKDGNWLAISELFTTAIFDEMLGKNKKPVMRTQAFPTKFKCNRALWLETGNIGDLDCPSLLFGFLQYSIIDFVLLNLLPIIMMLVIYPTVTAIVYEKQQKLRMIMKMQGLPMPVYYAVMYVLHYIMYVVVCALMSITGYFANVQFFIIHNQGVVWLFFLVWGHLMVAFGFFMSAFLSRMRTAMAMTFLFILIMWIVGGVLFQQFLTNPNTTEESYIPLMILPPWVMFRWVYFLGLASGVGEAIVAENWTTVGGGVLPSVLGIMSLHWFVFMTLYWYLENVMVVGHGTSKSCCFCLQCGSNGDNKNKGAQKKEVDMEALTKIPSKVLVEHEKWSEKMYPTRKTHVWKRPHDVEREHTRLIGLLKDNDPEKDNTRVKIMSMHKVFPANGGNPEKMAVKCVSFGVQGKECFGLLGHNGAGKTTLLNMLTGLYPATSGTTFVDGLRLETEMSQIYTKMGVCPQHDILWESLTGRDHIHFFGRLKGLSGDILMKETDVVLRSVNLSGSGDRRAGGYSGGMKRRLSVANSLIGNPDVVYMEYVVFFCCIFCVWFCSLFF